VKERVVIKITDMNHFTKTVCIIDTCSIINLDSIKLDKKDVLYYVRKFFDVQVCTVIRDEFQRHRNLALSREASYWSCFLSNKSYTPFVFLDDNSIIGPFCSGPQTFDGTKNAGEYGNTRVTIELLLRRSVGHVIFVTDDEKAYNIFLEAVQRSFPGISLWTSADIILYLGAILLTENKTSNELIKAALRDIYASRKKWDNNSQIEKDAIIKKLAKSMNSLKQLTKVIKHWRR
jgi:hypothetical protein